MSKKKAYRITITRTFEYGARSEEQAMEKLQDDLCEEAGYSGSSEWLSAAECEEFDVDPNHYLLTSDEDDEEDDEDDECEYCNDEDCDGDCEDE
jgi:hypothetical protein